MLPHATRRAIVGCIPLGRVHVDLPIYDKSGQLRGAMRIGPARAGPRPGTGCHGKHGRQVVAGRVRQGVVSDGCGDVKVLAQSGRQGSRWAPDQCDSAALRMSSLDRSGSRAALVSI